jgi:hemoglobin-like flavoprotein
MIIYMDSQGEIMRLYSQDSRVFTRTKEILRNHSTEFADHFYPELLMTNSDLATVFRNTDLSDQKEKLIEGVGRILELLVDADEKKLAKYLHDLGVRHICYEVTEKHYPIMREVLLKAVKHVHQSEWNQEYEMLWNSLSTTIIEHMIAGCRSIRKAS